MMRMVIRMTVLALSCAIRRWRSRVNRVLNGSGRPRCREGGVAQETLGFVYARFGAGMNCPSGFLIATQGALRDGDTWRFGAGPARPMAQVMETKTMLVSTVIFGDAPSTPRRVMVFDQAGSAIKPVTVQFDGQANRTCLAERPRFKAVVASFNYNDFDPRAKTTITVFPRPAARRFRPRLCRNQ